MKKDGEGKAKVLTDDELKRLHAAANSSELSNRNVAIIALSFGAGLRAKELASLRVEDVLDNKGKLADSFRLVNDQSKGKSGRTINIALPKIRKALNDHISQLDETTGPLFPSRKGGFMSPNSLQIALKNLYKAAGIEGASSHSGRRFFATNLYQAGIRIKTIQKLMGHRHISTTYQYVDNDPKAEAEAAAVINLW